MTRYPIGATGGQIGARPFLATLDCRGEQYHTSDCIRACHLDPASDRSAPPRDDRSACTARLRRMRLPWWTRMAKQPDRTMRRKEESGTGMRQPALAVALHQGKLIETPAVGTSGAARTPATHESVRRLCATSAVTLWKRIKHRSYSPQIARVTRQKTSKIWRLDAKAAAISGGCWSG